MADLLVRIPTSFPAERRYVLDVVLEHWLGISYVVEQHGYPETIITLRGSGGAIVMPDAFFPGADEAWLQPASLPTSPLPCWRMTPHSGPPANLPVLFGAPDATGDYLTCKAHYIFLGLDVFGSVFFLLSRYEEKTLAARDVHDRFSGEVGLSATEGLFHRPLADEYVEILWQLMTDTWPALRRREKVFEVALEHDLDIPFGVCGVPWSRVLLNAVGDLCRRRSPKLMSHRLRALLSTGDAGVGRDPHNSFDFIMSTSERHGVASTFFVKGGASDPRFDVPYCLDAPHVRKLLTAMHRRGHRIGIHPSYGTYRNGARLAAEFGLLRDACARLGIHQDMWGGRQHYLRTAVPETWRHYAGAGLSYDSTLGFTRNPGFRCGTCSEFPVFDLEQRRPLPLVERPLVVMEAAMLRADGSASTAMVERILRLADVCRHFGGCFRLLWHNDHLVTTPQRRLYADVVTEITNSHNPVVGRSRAPILWGAVA